MYQNVSTSTNQQTMISSVSTSISGKWQFTKYVIIVHIIIYLSTTVVRFSSGLIISSMVHEQIKNWEQALSDF